MGDVQRVPLFHPDGSVKGQIDVTYNNPPHVIIGARNVAALRCRDLFEYVKAVKKDSAVLRLLEEQEKQSSDVCVLFWKERNPDQLSMCTKTEIREGVVNGDSSPMVVLLSHLNLYHSHYPSQPAEAVQEFVQGVLKGV